MESRYLMGRLSTSQDSVDVVLHRAREVLLCVLLLSMAALVVVVLNVVIDIPRRLDLSGMALSVEVKALREGLIGEVQATRQDIDQQLTGIRSDSTATLRDFRMVADQRLGDTLTRADRTLSLLEGMRGDVQPVLASLPPAVAQLTASTAKTLAGVDALTQDGKDSLDDVYYDIKASVESGTVAMRGVAETAEAVGKATPAIAASASGIAADIHTATNDFVRPRTFWQKVKAWLETTGKIAARFI